MHMKTYSIPVLLRNPQWGPTPHLQRLMTSGLGNTSAPLLLIWMQEGPATWEKSWAASYTTECSLALWSSKCALHYRHWIEGTGCTWLEVFSKWWNCCKTGLSSYLHESTSLLKTLNCISEQVLSVNYMSIKLFFKNDTLPSLSEHLSLFKMYVFLQSNTDNNTYL